MTHFAKLNPHYHTLCGSRTDGQSIIFNALHFLRQPDRCEACVRVWQKDKYYESMETLEEKERRSISTLTAFEAAELQGDIG